jgi:hypothetical protein
MKKSHLVVTTIGLLISTINNNPLKAQGTFESDGVYNEESDYDDHDEAIFNNDPVFENYGFFEDGIEDRDNDETFDTNEFGGNGSVPIDGGLIWVAGGLLGYGISKVRKSKKHEGQLES